MTDYFLHFLGGLIVFSVHLYIDDCRCLKRIYRSSMIFTMYTALLWELAQLDVFWNKYDYCFKELLGYDWLNNGLDIVATVFGIALAIIIIEIGKRVALWMFSR